MERTQMSYFSIYMSCELPLSPRCERSIESDEIPKRFSLSLSAVEGKVFLQ